MDVLPTGDSLTPEDWERRHRQISVLLWLHVLLVPAYALTVGSTWPHAFAEASIVAFIAALASRPRFPPVLRSVMATLGLVVSSALLIHLSEGLIEFHFHFFVMVVVVSLYQAWQPFLVAVGFVVLHHGLLGVLASSAVFNHPAALAHPWRWALIHGLFLLGQSVACLVAWRVNEDALARERATRSALEKANNDLGEAQALSALGSWDYDIATRVLWWSDGMYQIMARDPDTYTPTPRGYLESIHPEDRARVEALTPVLTGTDGVGEYECRIVRGDGEIRTVHVRGQAVAGPDGELIGHMGTCQDITERKALESEVEYRALHDPLTDLGNRTLFFDRLDHALAVRARSPYPLAVLYLDLDGFKAVNDRLGHTVGDALLVATAQRLTASVRGSDTVARLGGDEFAILLEASDEADALTLADRIAVSLATPVDVDGILVGVRASIGIAALDAVSPATDLVHDADIAMYAAKRDGDSPRVFVPELLSDAQADVELETDLQTALERDEFLLHYQPIVDLRSGAITGVEALLRWDHPERGIIAPLDFLPLAERSGAIVPIGRWVTRQATRQVKQLQTTVDIPLTVAINLSKWQFSSDVATMVREAIADAGLDPACVMVEVTEGCLVTDEHSVIEQLQALRVDGVKVAIDDFGTGYSALPYLQRLPVDVLKIDGSFVQQVDGTEGVGIARAILMMAGALGLHTVCEGLERPDQVEAMRALGAVEGQGFDLARPMSFDDLQDLLGWWGSGSDPASGRSVAGSRVGRGAGQP